MYLYIKAFHIIFIVCWFAGLFYMPRLFIYATEANAKAEPDKSILLKQLLLMQQKLWYIITWPSAILTLFFGLYLLLQSGLITQGWMHIKLTFVFLLYGYHFSLQLIYKQQKRHFFKYTSFQLRLWNELATIFLFAIVFLIVVKTNLSWITGLVGLFTLVILLLLGIRIYHLIRNK